MVGVQRRAVWVAGRVFVRAVLSAASGVPPAEVPLLADARTGPRLPASDTNLSISHAGQSSRWPCRPTSTWASTSNRQAGCGALLTSTGSARTVLSPAESRRISPVGDDLADELLTSWVRKEAVVKALRLGLQVPFGAIEVRPDGIVEGLPVDGRPLRVLDLELGAHLVGAVAAPPGREVAVTVIG